MLYDLIALDKQILLWINGMHTPFLDFVMYWLSDKLIWIPFYLWLIWMIWKNYRNQIWIILGGVLLVMLISDTGSVYLFKNVFQRLRPCHNAEIGPLLHLIKGKCGGSYGFISSHASNTFAVALFTTFLLRNKYPWIPWLMFLWSGSISYSRMYLGAHFPADVFCGACWGIFSAVVVFWMGKKLIRQFGNLAIRK